MKSSNFSNSTTAHRPPPTAYRLPPTVYNDMQPSRQRTSKPGFPQGNDPFVVSCTPCVSWEQTQVALIAMGVHPDELGRWHNLYLWADIQKALQSGWDPREEIEQHLTPFFEYLGDRKFRCVAPVCNGVQSQVCAWVGAKKDRTISHICGHLDYNAWVCGGQCGRPGCAQRFAEKRNLDQHAKPDSAPCPICDKIIEHKRNLRKHMDDCH